jgi:hypothetical protein
LLAPALAEQSHGNSLLQNLNYNRDSAPLRFANEYVDVFGHHHEAEHEEAIAFADLLEDFQEYIPRPNALKTRFTSITAGGDEMKITAAVKPRKSSRHGSALY